MSKHAHLRTKCSNMWGWEWERKPWLTPSQKPVTTRTTWNQLSGVVFPKLVLVIKNNNFIVDIYQAFNAKCFMRIILPNLCHKPHELGTNTIVTLLMGIWANSHVKDLSKVSYLLNRRTWLGSVSGCLTLQLVFLTCFTTTRWVVCYEQYFT